ncbi:MAG: DNA methyltransferase [Candidatus Omnitrophica bacterium]|nr:DNA methyltransferase [Candidatus Omnitrophota bacterium]
MRLNEALKLPTIQQFEQQKYLDFLKTKIELAPEYGFEIDVGIIKFLDGTELKPHQKDIINWNIKRGRGADFASFGLGKTIIQLVTLQKIIEHEGGKALIVCPLGVKQEFTRDAAKEKLGLTLRYVKTQAECENTFESILITNYERVRDGNINPDYFKACTLDEANVLRSDGSKTHHTFNKKFKNVKYRFVATAAPSPNSFIEIIFYANFLGIMDKGQAKTRFFKRDSKHADKLTLYPHREDEFWLWVSSWAVFITKPSDFGYDDTGYSLPEMRLHYHCLPVDHSTAGFDKKTGQGKLYRDSSLSISDASKEKRDSLKARISKAVEIIQAEPDRHFILWHLREDERHALKKAIPSGVEVYGSLNDIDEKEKRIIDFSEGRNQYLLTKPQISGSGCNFQYHCSAAVFVSINYKFNDFIQAIYRIYRFLQKEIVDIHIIYTESEQVILDTLQKKWKNHERMISKMISIIMKYGLANIAKHQFLMRKTTADRIEKIGKLYTAIQNDTVDECSRLPDNHFGMILSSFPFSIQYEYSPSILDFGHNKTNEDFFKQLDFVTPNLLRVLQPGRICAVHVKDRIIFGNFSGCGFSTLYRFSDKTADHFEKHGFYYCGRITITTDVVRENNATYRLGWSENCKDGTKMGVGVPEYVLIFRKAPTDNGKAYADIPVEKSKSDYTRGRWQIDADSFWRSSGNRLLTLEDFQDIPVEDVGKIFKEFSRKKIYNYEEHVAIADMLEDADKLSKTFSVMQPASSHTDVWDDITRILTLNSEQKKKELEAHICPFQIDVVDRLIHRYTNPGDLIFDPFAGLGTVMYRAIIHGRRGYGVELNPVSYNDSLVYCEQAEEEKTAPTLFDLLDYEQEIAK